MTGTLAALFGAGPRQRGSNRLWPGLGHVRVYLRCAYILMPKQFLDGAYVVAFFQEVRCK